MKKYIKKEIEANTEEKYKTIINYMDNLVSLKKALFVKEKTEPFCTHHETFVYSRVYVYRTCKIRIVTGPTDSVLLGIKSKNGNISSEVMGELERILS